ncbi:BAR domain protein [Aspergillus sclerotialis]|uniref:BAR domain protein n=1 Tax=Aspergillus sclerotialis TaxID=2070753 RepID=A0A3A2ZF12_9EURO|nr:BAR domain protein [Aspergillus sclerotialis]
MNVNRKFDRFKQWAGERMGGEVKTSLSDDFKAMETEMGSMLGYVKSISKRNEGDDKEKTLPIANLGSSMVAHGDDFDANSEYGRCMNMFGKTEERLARIQEAYIAQATSTYLESLERSLAQMKEYQAARKKLDNRRLNYDTSLSKMQKAKKEDFRVEEELRTQKVKYEESNDDVYRRMMDIKDSEAESVVDLTAFLDAQLSYHEKCQEVLLQLRNEWPAGQASVQTPSGRRTGRARSATAHSYMDRYESLHEEPPNTTDHRPTIQSSNKVELPGRDAFQGENGFQRPALSQAQTFEGPMQLRRISENQGTPRASSQARPIHRVASDPYVDSPDEVSASSYTGTSPEYHYRGRSVSPATSHGSAVSSRTSSATMNGGSMNGGSMNKRAPPPPPPRSKKPPPPPPPMKRPLVAGDY